MLVRSPITTGRHQIVAAPPSTPSEYRKISASAAAISEQSETEHYDAIIIGTGQSGPALASRMGQEGLKVAIIERNRVGGTCVNVACIPTKTLVGSDCVAQAERQQTCLPLRSLS